ncbi:MAG TPA: ImmA/IrrE family metallo-endopeptidase [Pirellulaceae bacterium]|nr:ImmA/IrrE family metallo-endopeptidase [Pirellulaceae bacterium]
MKSKLEWTKEKVRLERASRLADEIVGSRQQPIDPLDIVRFESPLLVAGGRNLGNKYDGKLEYHRSRKKFLLFYNTKYDLWTRPGTHHPRTRFSVSHELGHYFIDAHREYLLRGGKAHPSSSENFSGPLVEREADAFAANLLLPTRLIAPIAKAGQLSIDRLIDVANDFQVSLLSTMIRCVRLTDFPCAVAGIKDGAVAWMFPSDSLIAAQIYPKRGRLPRTAQESWDEFESGSDVCVVDDGLVRNWFELYDRDDFYRIPLLEEYMPARSLDTLIVLLTLDEADVNPDDDEPTDHND